MKARHVHAGTEHGDKHLHKFSRQTLKNDHKSCAHVTWHTGRTMGPDGTKICVHGAI